MTEFAGIRVLVVEDEGAIAMMIEDMLEELGCDVVASVARLAAACDMARTVEIDLAMLDVNLAGQLVFPVAEILRDRNIPFLFSTGYGASGIPSEFDGGQILRKPFSESDLREGIALTLKRCSRAPETT
ncbi:response regulator [Stutzerimonas azotifigens]|uniref:Response regulator n=1 Tax=Stutzerimonas azotifigens TaxID=291995 RepID=A0ABR5Z1K1_9GAMM|nr:response regulator [Stutzerimonas azotifigens]MBA1274014.1 response regulator [Stutzerimonas azotifigens]